MLLGLGQILLIHAAGRHLLERSEELKGRRDAVRRPEERDRLHGLIEAIPERRFGEVNEKRHEKEERERHPNEESKGNILIFEMTYLSSLVGVAIFHEEQTMNLNS